jgi:hypothetical protein
MVAGERNKEIMGGIVEIGALVEPNMGNIYAIFFFPCYPPLQHLLAAYF